MNRYLAHCIESVEKWESTATFSFILMETILEAIGNTPLVCLKRSVPAGSANIFAKLEKFNPGGSLKDRIVLRIIEQAEQSGKLSPGGTIVAGTTGNSGIGLATISNVKKYKVVLTMPENFSLERRRILEAYGVELHLTPAAEGMKGAIQRAKKIAKQRKAFLFAQFENAETAQAHELTTACEIENELSTLPIIDAFVAGVGTGGSITGIGRVLKKKGTRIIAVEPSASPLLSQGRAGPHKIQGIGPGFIPSTLEKNLIDEIITVSDEEAFQGSREIAEKEGILAGISSGAAFVASKQVAKKLGSGKNVVTLFPDGGERYFSMEKYFK